VLEAQNMPKKPVVAIRLGGSLRHVDMALNTPFNVPVHGLQDNRIKVSLYEQLGTQTIPDAADELESEISVPVRSPDGSCSQVKLKVRRGQPSTGPNFRTSSIDIEDYLSHHQLEARMQSLFEIVLKQQPQDPYRCMIEELQRVKKSGEGPALSLADAKSSCAKTPSAPAGPPPANARPKQKQSAAQQKQSKEELAIDAALHHLHSSTDGAGAKESASLGGARQAARSAAITKASNLALAHEVMRMCIRQIVAKMASSSSSLGDTRNASRQRAIEHNQMVEASHHVMVMVVKDAYARLKSNGDID